MEIPVFCGTFPSFCIYENSHVFSLKCTCHQTLYLEKYMTDRMGYAGVRFPGRNGIREKRRLKNTGKNQSVGNQQTNCNLSIANHTKERCTVQHTQYTVSCGYLLSGLISHKSAKRESECCEQGITSKNSSLKMSFTKTKLCSK